MARFDESGRYANTTGIPQETAPSDKAALSLDLSSFPDARDFQQGDEVTLKIRAKVGGEPTQGGMTEMQIMQVDVEPMDEAASRFRQLAGGNRPAKAPQFRPVG